MLSCGMTYFPDVVFSELDFRLWNTDVIFTHVLFLFRSRPRSAARIGMGASLCTFPRHRDLFEHDEALTHTKCGGVLVWQGSDLYNGTVVGSVSSCS